MVTPVEQLRDLLSRPDPLPLDRAVACLNAVEQPGVEADAVLGELDQLARGLHLPTNAPLFERVARLHHHLFETHGFLGEHDRYDAPENSLLTEVLRSRRGLPITLSVVYLAVAERVGLPADAIGFPGHFLVSPQPTDDAPRFYVDPFYGGRVRRGTALRDRLRKLKVPDREHDRWLAPVDARAVLVRMSHNLRASYARRERFEDALRQVDRLLLIEPDHAEHHRVRGLLCKQIGAHPQAVAALHRALELDPEAAERAATERLIRELGD